MNVLEEGTELTLDFGKVAATGQDVLPVVLQHAESRDVLFVGYANQEALTESIRTGLAVLWSTSRNELWRKGATSGDVLHLDEVRVNCEQNSLLYLVRPEGGVCHTKDSTGSTRKGCYYRRLFSSGRELGFL